MERILYTFIYLVMYSHVILLYHVMYIYAQLYIYVHSANPSTGDTPNVRWLIISPYEWLLAGGEEASA